MSPALQRIEERATLLPAGTEVRLLASEPAAVYSAPLWRITDKHSIVRALLESGLEFAWNSVIAHGEQVDERSITALTHDTATDFCNDLSEENEEEGKGQRWTLIGAAALPPERELASARAHFLRTGSGLDLVIHQCNDSHEYIFLGSDPSPASLSLLHQFFPVSEARRPFGLAELWIKRTRKTGELPA